MADQRLQWRALQQAQPNVAPLLNAASSSFNNAADAASSILGRYEEGQKAKADQEVAQEIAGFNDEAELDAWLANGGLNGRKVSQGMLDNILGARSGTLKYANSRSIISDREGRLGIAQSANGRAQDLHGVVMNDHQFRQGRRDELTNLSGAVVGARTEGQDYGKNGVPSYVRYSNQNATRNKPLNDQLVNSMSFLGDLGVTMDVISGGQDGKGEGNRRTGSERHDHGNAADVDFYSANGRKLDWNNPQDLPLLQEIVGRARANGVTGIGAGDDYMGAGRFHIGFGSEATWGAGGKGENTPDWLKQAIASSVKYNSSTGSSTPNRDRLETALAESSYLSPSDINGLLDTNDSFIEQGTSAAAQEQAKLQEDILAQLTMDAVSNPENTTAADVQREVQQRALDSGEFSSSEALGATLRAESTIAGSEGIQTQLAPGVAEDVRFSNIVEGANEDIEAALGATPQGRMLRDVGQFREDPTAGLVSALNLGSDGENPGGLGGLLGAESGFDQNDLTNLINDYAAENKVSPEVAAAAMREAFVRDPLGRNTLANRFPATTVRELIENNLNQEDISSFRDQTRQREQYDQRLRTLNDEVQQLQRQAAKGGDRNAIQQRIAEIYTEMGAIRSQANELYRGSSEDAG